MAVCKKHAIALEPDPQQYYGSVAVIEEDLCVSCGRCSRVCPVLNDRPPSNTETPECYAVYADKDTIRKSASGGAFSLLAAAFLKEGGCVAGAAYGEDFHVRQELIEKEQDLDRLRRSKYVQSDMSGIYRAVAGKLRDHKVLFVGTPCQVAGIRSVFGSHENLYCVDLYCGHTPPAPVFEYYLDEKFGRENIQEYAFRTKQDGWVSDISTVTRKDGTQEKLRAWDDLYQALYHPRISMRMVCENCRFATRPRQGDLTIADFWWIEETHPEYRNELGTSAVLVNNERGRRLFQIIRKGAELCAQTELSAMDKNRPPKVSADERRDRFYELFRKKNFLTAADMALRRKYDIVLWGNWSERNYGSELTYYALYKVLTGLGYEVLMVERPKDAVWRPNDGPVLFRKNPYPAYALWVPETRMEMPRLNDMSDIFMVGSDQIWHHDLYDSFGRVCYLDFVYNTKKKIAYASSFGRDYWTGNQVDREIAKLQLQDFDAISVREKSGVGICRELFGTEAEAVLDPVFLCDTGVLRELGDSSKAGCQEEKYMAVYVLDESPQKETLLDIAQKELGYRIQVITDAFIAQKEAYWDRSVIRSASVEDWIANFSRAEYVITDSFHGMCLAILFHKPFIAISNYSRGANRFAELLEELSLTQRLISDMSDTGRFRELLNKPVDYEQVDAALDNLRTRSMQWLKNALEAEKVLRYSRADAVDIRFAALEQKLAEEKKLIDWHTDWLNYLDKIQHWHTERLDNIENWVNKVRMVGDAVRNPGLYFQKGVKKIKRDSKNRKGK